MSTNRNLLLLWLICAKTVECFCHFILFSLIAFDMRPQKWRGVSFCLVDSGTTFTAVSSGAFFFFCDTADTERRDVKRLHF